MDLILFIYNKKYEFILLFFEKMFNNLSLFHQRDVHKEIRKLIYIFKNTKFNMNYFNTMRINNKVNENIKRIRKEIRDK